MDVEQIKESNDFKRCVEFHGHVCPGLCIGFRAAKAGLEWHKEQRSEDEELVAIVENDSCSVDAIQVLTGCSFGKGNFIFKDYGKQVFVLFDRNSSQAVRISLKADALAPPKEIMEIFQKSSEGNASEEELDFAKQFRERKTDEILGMPLNDLFTVEATDTPQPDYAIIMQSIPCARCNEPTMESKLKEIDGEKVCRECLET